MAKLSIGGILAVGRNIVINGHKITVDGKEVDAKHDGHKLQIHVLEGVIESIKADGSVQCNNVTGDISAGGSVHCGDVGGDVAAGGSVKASSINGSIAAGGSVKIS